MAKVTVIECDNCHKRITEIPHSLKVSRKGSRTVIMGDLCGECASAMFGGYPTRQKPGRKNATVDAD